MGPFEVGARAIAAVRLGGCDTTPGKKIVLQRHGVFDHAGVFHRQILLTCRQIKDFTPILSANSF